MHELAKIGRMILENLGHVWPLLLISIPLAVTLRVSGLATRLKGAFSARPVAGILIATAAGAFSPFCSCTVIPMVASMLLGGIPLAPVMSFWIAAPTMDPEIFFMSAAFLGWDLAIARLVATLAVSLGAGFFTRWLDTRGWIGEDFLRRNAETTGTSMQFFPRLRSLWRGSMAWIRSKFKAAACDCAEPHEHGGGMCDCVDPHHHTTATCGCTISGAPSSAVLDAASCACEGTVDAPEARNPVRRVLTESLSAAVWVGQFLVLAFFLEALITLYVPQAWIAQWIGTANPLAPALAAFVGVPLYTGNLMALPLIGGLLEHGMDPGAALSFLIAGPVTTICAMTAVWGVVKKRVFALYIGIGLVGALVLGYAYGLVRLALRS